MKIFQNKTTQTTMMITWNASLCDDNDVRFAFMSGTMDHAHPLGQTVLTVVDRTLYDQNAEAAATAYEQFQHEVAEAADGFVGMVTNSEGDDVQNDMPLFPMF